MAEKPEELPAPRAVNMDVDQPPLFLVRSNSVPTINDCVPSSSDSVSLIDKRPVDSLFSERTRRRYSASFSPRPMSPRLSHSPRPLGRVDQLRLEESTEFTDREIAYENKLIDTIKISQSWEDFSIMLDPTNKMEDDGNKKEKSDGVSVFEVLQLNVAGGSLSACSSPSPTRMGLYRSHHIFKPSPSPSPTRKSFATRRSLSPAPVRASTLTSIKRKGNLFDNEPPAKRAGLLLAQARLDLNNSSRGSSVSSSIGTPESSSGTSSPINYLYGNGENSPAPSDCGDQSMPDAEPLEKPELPPTPASSPANA